MIQSVFIILLPPFFMPKSGRAYINAIETKPLIVVITNVKQIEPELAVLSFVIDNQRYDDIYNVTNPDVMSILLEIPAGNKVVEAVLVADASADGDSHPEVVSAYYAEEDANKETQDSAAN